MIIVREESGEGERRWRMGVGVWGVGCGCVVGWGGGGGGVGGGGVHGRKLVLTKGPYCFSNLICTKYQCNVLSKSD